VWFRPQALAGQLTSTEPTIVPTSALATVNPSEKLLSWKTFVSASVVPEMTAVSKPKSRPPREATIVLKRSVAESASHGRGDHGRGGDVRTRERRVHGLFLQGLTGQNPEPVGQRRHAAGHRADEGGDLVGSLVDRVEPPAGQKPDS
jgi:hypothetical protein